MSEEIKLVIAVPTAGMVRSGFAYSLAGMVGKIAGGVPTRPEATITMLMDMQESSVIHSNREQLAKRAIERGNTHLMFIDDDMQFEPQIAEVLLGRRQPVVAVNYPIKKFPMEFVAVAECGRRIVTKKESVGLQECAYTGFGVSLFEVEVFKKTPQPWFLPKFVPEADMYTTEDNPFFERIRQAGFKPYVDHDASKLVTAHWGGYAYGWQQWKPKEKE